MIQNVINKAVADRDWKRLHLLFLGGGGEKKYKNGSGGLATGCDASSVPLEEVIRNDLPILGKFINILLDHKADANPPRGRKSPLDVAIELGKIDVASILIDKNVKSGVSANSSERPKVKQSYSKTRLNLKIISRAFPREGYRSQRRLSDIDDVSAFFINQLHFLILNNLDNVSVLLIISFSYWPFFDNLLINFVSTLTLCREYLKAMD